MGYNNQPPVVFKRPNMHPSRSSMHPRFDMDAFNASHSEGHSHTPEDDDTGYYPSVRISHFSTPSLYGGHGRNSQSYSDYANSSAFSTPLDTSFVYSEASNRTDYHYWNTDSVRYTDHGLPTLVNPICLYCQQGVCSIPHHVDQTFPANVGSHSLFSPSTPSPHHWSPQHHFTYPGQASSSTSGVGRASTLDTPTSFERVDTLYRHTLPPTSRGLPFLSAPTNLFLTQETVASPRDTCDCDCEDGESVPQRPWIPVNGSSLEDIVHNASVTFDVGEKSGILALEALEKKFRGLVGRDDHVLPDCGSSISLRLEWPGYDAWTKQIRIKNWQKDPQPIVRSKLAYEVARNLERFVTEMQDKEIKPEYSRWQVGSGFIEVDRLKLVALEQVSKASFQPHVHLLS